MSSSTMEPNTQPQTQPAAVRADAGNAAEEASVTHHGRSQPVDTRPTSAITTDSANCNHHDVPARPGRLRSYEDGEYQRAQKLASQKQSQQGRIAKKSQCNDDYNDVPGDLLLSPPGWKDLATAGWERKNKHKQKYRAARAANKQESAENTSEDGTMRESPAGRRSKSPKGHGGTKGRRSPGGNSRREARNGRRFERQARYDGRRHVDGQEKEQREENEAKGHVSAGSGSVRDDGEGAAPDGRSESEGELGVVQAQIAELKAELNIE